MPEAFVYQISTSPGGVPKMPVAGPIRVDSLGVAGDGHNDTRHHGGPDRALCLFSLEVIDALRAEGHPIAPGYAGENLTISGLDWSELGPGDVLHVGDTVTAELTSPTTPCAKNAAWFAERDFRRMDNDLHPGWSRWYARVLAEGTIEAGDEIRYHPASGK